MNIQKQSINLFGGACYAFCIAYLKHKTTDYKILLKEVVDAYDKGYITSDGFVAKPQFYFGSKDVEKVPMDNLLDLPGDKLYIVEYQWNGKSHFVVCSRYTIVFDPWENSDTVKYGKPVSYRKFKE